MLHYSFAICVPAEDAERLVPLTFILLIQESTHTWTYLPCQLFCSLNSSMILKGLFTLLASTLLAIVLRLSFLILSFTWCHSRFLMTPSETGSAGVWHFLHTNSLKVLLMSLITAIIILTHLSLTTQQRAIQSPHFFFYIHSFSTTIPVQFQY